MNRSLERMFNKIKGSGKKKSKRKVKKYRNSSPRRKAKSSKKSTKRLKKRPSLERLVKLYYEEKNI